MTRASSNGIFSGGVKTFATLASSGAAVVSILTFLHSWGVIGTPDVRATVGGIGAKWIGVRPLVDTARALRDTLHLAATITDKNGAILYGAKPVWTTENPAVATVDQDGSVVARGAGATTIIALVGELSARSRIVVHQTVHRVRVSGDSAVAMAEGDARALAVEAFDRRGYVVPQRAAAWSVQSGSGVTVDSAGTVRATDAGNAIVSASVDGIGSQVLVRVRPSPSTIAIVKGDAQRGRAGESLREPVVVRVVNHRGTPVEGTLVRFRPDARSGVVDPAAVVTDVDGRARTTWTLDAVPGRQRILASVERIDSALSVAAEAHPVPANTRVIVVRDSIRGIVGQRAESIAVVRLTDSTGKALSDIPVAWAALDGGAADTTQLRTDSLGEVRTTWMLGAKAGVQRLRAKIAGDMPPVTLTAIASPDPAVVMLQAAQKARADSVQRAKARAKATKSVPARRTTRPTASKQR